MIVVAVMIDQAWVGHQRLQWAEPEIPIVSCFRDRDDTCLLRGWSLQEGILLGVFEQWPVCTILVWNLLQARSYSLPMLVVFVCQLHYYRSLPLPGAKTFLRWFRLVRPQTLHLKGLNCETSRRMILIGRWSHLSRKRRAINGFSDTPSLGLFQIVRTLINSGNQFFLAVWTPVIYLFIF